MKAPPRLLDDTNVASSLKADLRRAQELRLDPTYDSAKGLAALSASLDGVDPSSAGPASGGQGNASHVRELGSGAASALPKKLLLVMGGLGTVGLLSALWLSGGEGGAPKNSDAETHVASSVSDTRPPTFENRTTKEEQGAGPDGSPSAPPAAAYPAQRSTSALTPPKDSVATPKTRAQDPEGQPATPSTSSATEEIAQLQKIRLALKSDPASAYDSAMEGHRQYPGGMLYEEREGLAILALVQMGKQAAAAKRATGFLENYPRSSLAPQIRKSLSP